MTRSTRFASACSATIAAIVAVGLCSFVAAPAASAAPGVKYGITDDAWLQNGPGSLETRLAELDTIGARVVRFSLHWDQIAATEPSAPSDPSDTAYDWTAADQVLNGLHAHGIDVIVQLVGTPRWANAGLPANYAPTSSSTFRSFASAAAQRYSWVSRWLIWNEPNQRRWLRPTTAAVYTSRLLNPAYAAIHAVIPGAEVAGGGTAPRGSTGGISPVAWLLGMRAAHARLDAYAHNPYPLDPRRETPLTGGCTHCATITMATISRLGGLVARNFPRARIWLTEYGYQSNPPDRLLGVSPALQARYESEGAYVAYRTPRVDLLIQFLYRDEPNLARFQSGLVTLGDTPKPAYAAFEAPLAETMRSGPRVALWGQLRAPAAVGQTARLEERFGATWRPLATVPVATGGFIRWAGNLPHGAAVRLGAGSVHGAALVIH
jgi:hypothetical protein